MKIARPLSRTALIVVGLLLLALTLFFLFSSVREREEQAVTTAAFSPTAAAESGPAATPPTSPTAPLRETGTAPPPTVSLVTPFPTALAPTRLFSPTSQLSQTPTLPVLSTPAPLAPVSQWERTELPELGLAFEIPAAWSRLEGEQVAWSPDGSRGAHVGVDCGESWIDLDPQEVWQPPAQIVYLGEIDLGWTQGSSYRVEVRYSGRLLAVERHLVINLEEELACDFYNTGRTWADQAVLWPVLYQAVSSLTYRAGSGGPIDATIQFLGALQRDPSGGTSASLVSSRLQGQNLLALLGQGLYRSFTVAWQSAEGNRVFIQVTLLYTSGRTEERLLTLFKEGDLWLVDAIDPLP